jgi:hypothetical protein
MKVPKMKAFTRLHALSKEGETMPAIGIDDGVFKKWRNDCQAALRNIFDNDSPQLKEFDRVRYTPSSLPSLDGDNSAYFASSFRSGMTTATKLIESYAREVHDFWPEDETPRAGDSNGGDAGSYDVAQICPNGHVANSSSVRFPQFNQVHCEKCGEKTITSCPHCQASIRGRYIESMSAEELTPPAFCQNCGSAFPWTERAMQSAIELATESGDLNPEEQQQFTESIHEIARDTPKGQVAGSRVARLLKKMGKTTADAVRDILVDIASETAKKMIWPEK